MDRHCKPNYGRGQAVTIKTRHLKLQGTQKTVKWKKHNPSKQEATTLAIDNSALWERGQVCDVLPFLKEARNPDLMQNLLINT